MLYQQLLSHRAREAESSPIDELFGLLQRKSNLISFAAGAPDSSVLPVELLDLLTRRATERHGLKILQYGLTQGFPPLREALLPLLATRRIRCSEEDVHISTGGSGALNNVCMALLDKGDTVLVERPTYSPAVKVFRSYEANVVAVASDEEGMIPQALEDQLRRAPAKLVFLLPTFQNPTGRTMFWKRRQQLVEVARKYDTLIVEDDVYFHLRYRGEDMASLCSLAPERVIYVGSLSKMLAPSLRVGFAVMPKPILAKTLLLKQGIDMQTSSFTQAIATEFLTSEHAATHQKRLVATYARKLKTMTEALRQHMPSGFTWRQPEGGMFLWIQGPQALDANMMLRPALKAGVAFVPGESFFVDPGEGKNTFRLSFASAKDEEIAPGIEILARVCRSMTHV